MTMSESVRVVEVAPRDGLQNESHFVSPAVKAELIERLVAAGERSVEAAAFVSPKWVPQMADSAEVMRLVRRVPGATYSALTPNIKGFEAALAAGADEVAVFAAASESFSHANLNCSIDESIDRFMPVVKAAKSARVPVRAYVSCVLGCPYEGEVAPERVAEVAGRLLELGCYEISLGDTIGVGTPRKTSDLIRTVSRSVPVSQLAGHFHDTYGQALVNVYAAMDGGVRVFDSSVSGLGGCPYAPGAQGNLATEDLVYMLQGMGVDTGVDLDRLVDAGAFICGKLGCESRSRVALALMRRRCSS